MKNQKYKDSLQFVQVPWSFFEGKFWKEKRVFNKAEAWIDLLRSKRYSDSPIKKLIGCRVLTWEKNQMPVSIRFLAKRWNWSKDRVERFIKLLVSENLILVDRTQCGTLFTILSQKQGHPTGHQQGQLNPYPDGLLEESPDTNKDGEPDAVRTLARTKQIDSMIDRIDRESISPPALSFKVINEKQFGESIAVFKDEYPKEMLREFYEYWKEQSPSGKMRFQLENTWEVNLRLKTWKKREKSFGNKNGSDTTANMPSRYRKIN